MIRCAEAFCMILEDALMVSGGGNVRINNYCKSHQQEEHNLEKERLNR